MAKSISPKTAILALIVSLAVVSASILIEDHLKDEASGSIENSNSGIIVPLYFDPNASWNYLIQLHSEFPNLPIIVIINPDNGPGMNYSRSYSNYTATMEKSGITVLGYVYSSYGTRSLETLKLQAYDYLHWYGIRGIFMDEVSDNSTGAQYYRNATLEIRTAGLDYIVGNPGTYAPKTITDLFNLTVLYENTGAPLSDNLSTITNATGRAESSIIAINVSSLSVAWFQAASEYFSFIYVTNLGLPNPYYALPSYLPEEMQFLSST